MILSGLFDFIKISLDSYQVANGLTFQKNSQRVISTQNNDKNQNWEKNKINDILYV